MSQEQAPILADGLRLSINHARGLLDGVTADQFGRFAAPSGSIVVSNHPAFIYGHLALYSSRIVAMAGGTPVKPPDGFSELFANGVECEDDTDGTKYPAMQIIADAFFSGYESALDAVRSADDEVLNRPNPAGGTLTERFPTCGSMCSFMGCGHVMLHMGQMSAWRRMQGLGPA